MTRKKKKTLNMGSRQKKAYRALNKRLAMYTDLVRGIIEDFASEASRSAQSTGYTKGEKPFAFSDYPETRHAVTRMKQNFVNNMSSIIYNGVSQEWRESNLYQDMLAEDFLRETNVAIDGQKRNHYYETDNGALKAFRRRQDKGLKLSTNIWNQAKDMQTELEATLSCAIEKGMDAVTLSKRVSKYLRDYDKIKKDYKELYGKAVDIHDCEYRSMRLARSEINMAYRSAENARWQDMDFVIGMQIKTSNNHSEIHSDVCDELAGKYPKDFDWVGWHPNCRCFKIPILKKPSEAFDEDGESKPSPDEVKEMPDNFKNWAVHNKGRILAARDHGTEPYFIRDNRKVVNGILNKKKIDDIAEERHANRTPEKEKKLREYWNAKVAEGVERRKRQAVLDAAAVRHATRTPEQIADIKQRAQERQKKHILIKKTANNILNVAKEYAEVDFSALEKCVKDGNLDAMREQIKIVAKKIVEVKADEKFLSTLIPDTHNWHKQFTSKELHEVFDAVESKMNSIKSQENLGGQKAAVHFEIDWIKKHCTTKYKTWEVSVAAYAKQEQLLGKLVNIEKVKAELPAIKDYIANNKASKELVLLFSEAQVALNKNDVDNLEIKLRLLNKKWQPLKKSLARDPGTAELEKYISEHYTEEFTVVSQESYERVMRGLGRVTKDPWRNATDAQRASFPYYTNDSSHSLRILTNVGLGKPEPQATLMDAILDKIKTEEDLVLRSGQNFDVAGYVFGENFKAVLESGDLDKLNKEFRGTIGVNKAYMSTSFNKEGGFTKQFEVHIFAPKGTHCMNLNELSAYGQGRGVSWDGEEFYPTWKSTGETEIFLHRGYTWKFIRAEHGTGKDGTNRIYVQLLSRAVK